MKNIGAKSREIDLIGFDVSIDDELSFIATSDEDDGSSLGIVVVMIDDGGLVTGILGGTVEGTLGEKLIREDGEEVYELTVLLE